MSTAIINAAASGTFTIGTDLTIHRLGFGAMRITGPGIWGEPKDREEARRVLRRAAELGVNFIDTADSYGPGVSEDLIAEALYPYPNGLVIATKGGLTRQGPNQWAPVGRPEYLRQQVEMSLRRLRLECIDLYQLHRIDPKVPVEESLGATDRTHEPALRYCEANRLGFIPWFPVAAGKLARPGGPLDDLARRHGASVAQLSIAWLLHRSPVMLPIPGTSSVRHLEENIAAGALRLPDEEWDALERSARPEAKPV